MGDFPFSAYRMAQGQFDRAAQWLGLDSGTRELLRQPLREYEFSILIRMDDGDAKVFHGFRVQHNDARGPCAGGVRFHPRASLDVARARAMWMTWECAVADIPLGGATGGIACDPHQLSQGEQEALCRGWVRQLGANLGPIVDIPAPDVMTHAQHMVWMLDEFEAIHGGRRPGFSAGKPVGLGGSPGRDEATGFGIACAIREACRMLGIDIRNTRASCQGFGNVARHAVRRYLELGGAVTCVSSWHAEDHASYAFRKKEGVNLKALRGITDRFGEIDRESAAILGYEVLPGEAWLEQDVEILIPAAIETQVTGDNAGMIHPGVIFVVEGAEGSTTPEADEALKKRGIFVIPDLLAGGAVCSHFELVQSGSNHYWEKNEVLDRLDLMMSSAFRSVSELHRANRLSMRDAAYAIAAERVARACRDRGWV